VTLSSYFFRLGFTVLLAADGAVALQTCSPALDVQGYRAILDKWSIAVDRVKSDPRVARKLQRDLPDAWRVVVRDQRFSVPTRWIAQELDAVAANPHLASGNAADIRKRLALMRAQAEQMAEAPSFPTDDARKKLTAILSRREFRAVHGPSATESLWDRLYDWIAGMWGRLFGGAERHPSVRNTLIWVLLTGLGVFLVTWLVPVALGRTARSPFDLSGPILAREGWHEWARKALACARNGDYRDAIRMAYWAAVHRMEERGLWQVDHTRTPREFLKLLPRDHPQHASLAALTSRFERFWYGGREASRDDFLSVLGELETLGCPLRLQPSNPAIASS
jgi:hypothetical protein